MTEGFHSETHEEVEIKSLEEFVGYHFRLEGRWIFRGQRDGRHDPIPEIDRPAARDSRRNDGTDRERQERGVLELFQQRSLPYLDPHPSTTLQWLAVARHHGLWTRLLDWTENALAALYFAVEGDTSSDFSNVYCYFHHGRPDLGAGSELDDVFTFEHLVIYHPPHISSRIAVQSALFTFHPAAFYEFDGAGTLLTPWPDKWSGLTRTIRIPRESRREIRIQLRRLGVHRASLFPDADGVAWLINELAQ